MPRQIALPTPPQARSLSRRRFLKWSGAAGAAALGGAYWSIGPTVRRARATGPADTPLQHVVISMQENRSFDHYFGYAPWIGAGRAAGRLQRSPTGPAGRSPRTGSRASRRRTCRIRGAPSTSSGTAAPWTASTRTPGSGRSATTPRPSCRSTTGCTRLDARRQLLLLAARADLAEPLLPHVRDVGRDHHQRPVGLRDLRLPDDPRPARRRRRDLEDLQPRLGQRAVRQHRQRGGLLGALRARQPDARQQGRATSTTCARAACPRCRS